MSCIVPVWNGEAYLREAIDSVLRQTHAPVEVIVVDDGSTDGTPAVIDAYGDRVLAVRLERAGPAAARNAGLRRAGGDLLAFLDADDLWHEAKLERQVAVLARRPEVDLCFTQARHFWDVELRAEEERLRGHRIAQPMPAWLPSSMLARRRVFDIAGLFDDRLRFSHSTEWLLRTRAHGLVAVMLDEILYLRRLHPGNRSRRSSAASREEFLRIVKAHADRQGDRRR